MAGGGLIGEARVALGRQGPQQQAVFCRLHGPAVQFDELQKVRRGQEAVGRELAHDVPGIAGGRRQGVDVPGLALAGVLAPRGLLDVQIAAVGEQLAGPGIGDLAQQAVEMGRQHEVIVVEYGEIVCFDTAQARDHGRGPVAAEAVDHLEALDPAPSGSGDGRKVNVLVADEHHPETAGGLSLERADGPQDGLHGAPTDPHDHIDQGRL